MTNLEIANEVLENKKVSFELSFSMERISDDYLDKLKSKIENEWSGEIYEELVSLDEVDNYFQYIAANIQLQLERKVSINERYETISLNVIIK
jgi:DNA-directed RNA polymerase subunit F